MASFSIDRGRFWRRTTRFLSLWHRCPRTSRSSAHQPSGILYLSPPRSLSHLSHFQFNAHVVLSRIHSRFPFVFLVLPVSQAFWAAAARSEHSVVLPVPLLYRQLRSRHRSLPEGHPRHSPAANLCGTAPTASVGHAHSLCDQECERVIFHTWTSDPSIVAASHLLPALNESLLSSPVLIQAYGRMRDREPPSAYVPFPLNDPSGEPVPGQQSPIGMMPEARHDITLCREIHQRQFAPPSSASIAAGGPQAREEHRLLPLDSRSISLFLSICSIQSTLSFLFMFCRRIDEGMEAHRATVWFAALRSRANASRLQEH